MTRKTRLGHRIGIIGLFGYLFRWSSTWSIQIKYLELVLELGSAKTLDVTSQCAEAKISKKPTIRAVYMLWSAVAITNSVDTRGAVQRHERRNIHKNHCQAASVIIVIVTTKSLGMVLLARDRGRLCFSWPWRLLMRCTRFQQLLIREGVPSTAGACTNYILCVPFDPCCAHIRCGPYLPHAYCSIALCGVSLLARSWQPRSESGSAKWFFYLFFLVILFYLFP